MAPQGRATLNGRRARIRRPFGPSWRLTAEQHGFTLIEGLVASAIMLVILGATLAALQPSTKAENRDRQWALAVQDGQTGLARMMHEIRQAYSVLDTSPSSIDFLATLGGQQVRVLYACNVPQPGTSYNECVRLQTSVGGTLPALSTGAPIILRLQNATLGDPVFTYTPDGIRPQYIDAKVDLPASGELSGSSAYTHRIVLTSGAYLRNNLGVDG
jgi:prepilin-type N-terminal cleavage/methylation domain-containing protein